MLMMTENYLIFTDDYERNHCVSRGYVGAVIEEKDKTSSILKCVDGTWNRVKSDNFTFLQLLNWYIGKENHQ